MAHATTPLYSAPPVIWPGMPTGIACMLIHQWLISCDPFLKKCVEWLSLPVQVVFFFTAFFLCSWQRTWCWCTDALPCLVHDMVLLCISVPYWCTSVHLPMHCRALCTTCGADALMHRCTAVPCDRRGSKALMHCYTSVPCARRVVLMHWCTDALPCLVHDVWCWGSDALMHWCTSVPCARRVVLMHRCTSVPCGRSLVAFFLEAFYPSSYWAFLLSL